MYKICNTCSSLLKNNTYFVLKTPEQHNHEFFAASYSLKKFFLHYQFFRMQFFKYEKFSIDFY